MKTLFQQLSFQIANSSLHSFKVVTEYTKGVIATYTQPPSKFSGDIQAKSIASWSYIFSLFLAQFATAIFRIGAANRFWVNWGVALLLCASACNAQDSLKSPMRCRSTSAAFFAPPQGCFICRSFYSTLWRITVTTVTFSGLLTPTFLTFIQSQTCEKFSVWHNLIYSRVGGVVSRGSQS